MLYVSGINIHVYIYVSIMSLYYIAMYINKTRYPLIDYILKSFTIFLTIHGQHDDIAMLYTHSPDPTHHLATRYT